MSSEDLKSPDRRLPQNLPEESLASLDEWGDRIFMYPAKVRGFWHKRRRILYAVLMLIFLILPWLNVGGHQAVLINLPERQFAFFGLTFWAHDAPLIFFILAGLTLGLALVTAIWGRAWCGWACPQTVFIETVFRKIEEWVEGNHIQRRRLNESPPSAGRFFKKTFKWTLYTLASLVITHSFLAYFVGSERLLEMVQHSPKDNWIPFLVILFTTAVVLFDFGWFREQFCIIMCPYGRFQSVLMDHRSLTVAYDVGRGEPRRGVAESKVKQGDCIDCRKCVAVCPTGIDIRNGLQMECIACTACIDACDEVMEKIKKPKGLIRYTTERFKNWSWYYSIVRPRVLAYSGLLVLVAGGLAWQISTRETFYVSLVRAIETPYKMTTRPDGSEAVLNHFKVSIRNHLFEPMTVSWRLDAEMEARHRMQVIAPFQTKQIEPGATAQFHLFVQFNKDLVEGVGAQKVPLIFETASGSQASSLNLVGPK